MGKRQRPVLGKIFPTVVVGPYACPLSRFQSYPHCGRTIHLIFSLVDPHRATTPDYTLWPYRRGGTSLTARCIKQGVDRSARGPPASRHKSQGPPTTSSISQREGMTRTVFPMGALQSTRAMLVQCSSIISKARSFYSS